MSVSRTVFLQRARLPTAKDWAAAIRAAGFDLEFDPEFDVGTQSGFLPCRHEGREAGFEYYLDSTGELEPPDEVLSRVGARDVGISFVTHSSMRELVSAVIAAAVLCELTDGVIFDEEANDFIAADAAVADARELVASVQADLE